MDYEIAGMETNNGPNNGSKLLICMVGVSGCGKTYCILCYRLKISFVAHRIRKFLTWKGYNAKVITCSETRVKYYPEYASPSPDFFSEENKEVGLFQGFHCLVCCNSRKVC